MTLDPVHTSPRSTLRGQIVKEILKSIFTGETAGGTRLVEAELAQRLGVSRTPVREALGELAGIGFIHLKPNHGAVVRNFGPSQLYEIYHMRRILESEATRLAHPRLSPMELRSLRARHQTLLADTNRGKRWSEAVIVIDQQFHEMLSQCGGSQRLAEEIDRYRTLVQTLREAIGNRFDALNRALAEHTEIIDHLLNNQPVLAAQAMERHIDRGAETAIAALSTRGRALDTPLPANSPIPPGLLSPSPISPVGYPTKPLHA
jgi:DNA-binding GntR family transcriptional regulator